MISITKVDIFIKIILLMYRKFNINHGLSPMQAKFYINFHIEYNKIADIYFM